jgi:methionyl-tRNA formyltransferase
MKFEKIGILVSKSSWLNEYIPMFIEKLENNEITVEKYEKHEDINTKLDVLFILSYFRIIEKHILVNNRHNIVVHESDLPKDWKVKIVSRLYYLKQVKRWMLVKYI